MSKQQRFKRPSRIVEGPIRVKSATGGHPLKYKCDDGNWYMQKELAALANMSPAAFGARLKREGLDHPNSLRPPDRRSWRQVQAECAGCDSGMGDLARLSGKVRNHNLSKIKIGTMEMNL